MRRSGAFIAMAVLAAVAGLAFYRGARFDLYGNTLVYYVVTYGDGLMRRGLIGQLVSPFVDPNDTAGARAVVTALYLALQAVLYVGLFAWVWILERGRRDYLMLALFAVFLTAQFVPTLAHDVGFLDIYDCLLLLLAAIALARGRLSVVAAVGLVGPFIHESFIVLWSTIAIMALWERVSVSRIAVLCAPVVSGVILSLAASNTAAASQLAASAIRPDDISEALLWHFGQTAFANLETMIWKIRYNTVNVLLASLLCLPPALAILAVYGWARRSWRDVGFIAAATVAPLCILLVAWDLTRFLAWANFSVLLAILYCEAVRPAGPVQARAPLACAASAAIFIQVPFVYGYLEQSGISDRLDVIRQLPIGRATTAIVEFYNRNIGPAIVEATGTEQPPGDIWYVEAGGWRGGWIRRPGTRQFDAVMTKGRAVTGFTVDVERRGNLIIARQYPDLKQNVRSDFSGILKDGVIEGTFVGGPWRAEIRQ